MKSRVTILLVLWTSLFFGQVPARAWDPMVRDGATGAALGCLFGGCKTKNVARGAAAAAVASAVPRWIRALVATETYEAPMRAEERNPVLSTCPTVRAK